MSFDGQGSETGRYGLNGSAFTATGENVGTGDFPADDQIAFAEYTSLQTDWAYIGAMNTGGTPNYRPNLNMKEVIIYDQNMTSVERARLESYLHIKYDISRVGSDDGGTTIDERDYLASDSTVFWDYSANSAFDDMIAGLGRDDISSLYDTIGASVDGDVLQIEKEDSIQTNKQFFVWGHNNRIVDSWRVVDTPAGIQGRIARIWKAQETDDLDTLKLVFDLSQVYGPGGNGGNDLQFVRLLIDTDTNFAAGATIINSTIFNNTSDLVEFDYTFDGTEGYFFSLGSTDTANAPLNLQNIKLAAKEINNQVQLKWSAISSLDEEALLLRGLNTDEFEVITDISATELKEGSFLDQNPHSGWNYYQIQSPSLRSQIQAVFIEESKDLRLYPNILSTNGNLLIRSSQENQELSWSILGIDARQLHGQAKFNNGKLEIPLAEYDLSPGVYFLEIPIPPGTRRFKFVLN